ncbi:histidine kinase N-terminal 7TM domain-containing protein [Halomicroarcula sp. GCM10025709]|uniref:sensor histidine kinase n=1 Tax=Haloarcula TaxID=2237 RepID=UPI0024C26363|nr:histidine kinase N-terminal 7TM domain-containing protein [Halomicroarcula sp. YJ-61-S]
MYSVAVLSVVLSVVVGGTAAAWLLARHDRGTTTFALGVFLLVLTGWTATHLGALFADSRQWLLVSKQLSYVGVVTTPIAWFAFALRYTDRGDWLTWRRLVLLSVVPVTTLLMVFTAQYHSLYYTSIGVSSVNGHAVLRTTPGPWHAVNIIYSYSLLLGGTGLLVAAALSDNRLYRRQSAVLVGCITVPWLVNMSYHLDRTPFPWFDATPMAFIATGIPLAVVVLRTDLASFLPVAYERVFRSLDDPIVVIAPDGRIIDANDAARTVLGSGAAVEGRPATAVLPDELHDAGTLCLDFGETIECAQRYAGQSRRYLGRRQPIASDTNGVERGSIVTLTEITARVERNRELEQLSKQARRKNEQLERMAGVISHDMAAPLSTAEKTLSLLRSDLADPDPPVEQSLDDLASVHDRLRGFAENLPRLARESVDVQTTDEYDLEAVVQAAWNTVDTGTLELTVTDSRSIHADRGRLQQVFENLFRNTVQHATIGDHTVTTTTRTGQASSNEQASATTVRVGTCERGVFVEDDGPGISPKQRETVFEYGMSTADSSGFGLAIVRTIVEAHGWEIDVADSGSEGARFEITIDDAPTEP